jgi:hypothetical protein
LRYWPEALLYIHAGQRSNSGQYIQLSAIDFFIKFISFSPRSVIRDSDMQCGSINSGVHRPNGMKA